MIHSSPLEATSTERYSYQLRRAEESGRGPRDRGVSGNLLTTRGTAADVLPVVEALEEAPEEFEPPSPGPNSATDSSII